MGGLWSDIQCFVPWCVKSAPDRGPAARAHSPPRQSLYLVGAFLVRPASQRMRVVIGNRSPEEPPTAASLRRHFACACSARQLRAQLEQ